MYSSLIRLLALMGVFILAGCSSILEDGTQTFTIESSPKGASCKAVNGEGTYLVGATPQTISVNTDCEALVVTCEMEGYSSNQVTVEHSHKTAAFGNIIAGGGVGYLVDRSNGSACHYPQSVLVTLSKE